MILLQVILLCAQTDYKAKSQCVLHTQFFWLMNEFFKSTDKDSWNISLNLQITVYRHSYNERHLWLANPL